MNPSQKSKSAGAHAATAAKEYASHHAAALAEAQLREVTVRITTPVCIKVLATLLEARCASSHSDMQDQFIDMDRVTLYPALDCPTTDAGLAHKIAGDDRVFRYSAGAEHNDIRHHGRAGAARALQMHTLHQSVLPGRQRRCQFSR